MSVMSQVIKTLTLALLITFSFLAVSKVANADEKLDLELLCEGKATYSFGALKTEDGLELLLASGIISEMESEGVEFSERLSIKNNKLGKVELTVTDTLIETPNLFEDSELVIAAAKDTGFEISKFTGSIDRLTGRLDARIEFSAVDTSRFEGSSAIPIIETVWSSLEGVDVSGQCMKLDPKKKLF
jgi:hypothetical protein